ncbi:hypothetical protein MNBD_GAMMA18-2177 [hydrothermal vent metagenome]|uniref:Cytochrome c domain-containing protein n=1 Tax=hydrothermal vent metagenome TaxID=652676 RepID=A0A3B0ZBQ0_9ZZZZ
MNNQSLKHLATLAITLLSLLGSSIAFSSDIEGDIETGRSKAVVCNHCHKDNNDSSIPKIAGQHENYLVKQMLAYRDGQRKDEIMETIISRLKHQDDIYDLAAYFSSLPVALNTDLAKKQNPLGHEVFNDKVHCYQCHGVKGDGNPLAEPIIPSIAGQNKDYIIKRLMEFQSQNAHQSQSNPMSEVAKQLDIVDIFSVSEYVSGMQPEAP